MSEIDGEMVRLCPIVPYFCLKMAYAARTRGLHVFVRTVELSENKYRWRILCTPIKSAALFRFPLSWSNPILIIPNHEVMK